MTALRVGTRGSALALAQARWVAERLSGAEIVEITTSGDRARGIGDKSRWVDTIEAALVAGEIDLAVHSAKDVPADLAPGCERGATPPRAHAEDVLVGAALGALAPGARVGTSSLRRRAQLLAARADLEIVELRGNVDTRLRKLDAGDVDAIVLAAAGLERLGIDRAAEVLDFVPAPGQGTLAIEARADDERVRAAVAAVHDPDTFAALTAERAAVRVLEASCYTPVGIHARDGTIRGFVGLPDGSAWVTDEVAGEDGAELARRMLAAGAGTKSSASIESLNHAPTLAALRAERAAVRVLEASCHTPVGIHAQDGTIRGFVGLPDGSAWVADEVSGEDGEALARRMLAAGAGDLLAQAEAMA